MSRWKTGLVVLVILLFAAVLSELTTSTPSMTSSEYLSTPSYITNTINNCDQDDTRYGSLESSMSATDRGDDCDCPSGYINIREYTLAEKENPLCVSLRSPEPWGESCISSGTATDYYDLSLEEMALVRNFLHATNVTECWISARLVAPGGALVRRLPGARWNERIELESRKTSVTLARAVHSLHDQGCAAIGGAQLTQLAIRNCSEVLHQLCLYRENTLLQLHCGRGEWTTRYKAMQRYCFSVKAVTSGLFEWIWNSTEYQLMNSTTARNNNLVLKIISASHVHCTRPIGNPMLPLNVGLHHRVMRAQNALFTSALGSTVWPPTTGVAEKYCVALQRIAAWNRSVHDGVTSSSMHLHFERGRHKLFLTVYGGWRFWREQPSDNGFGCYTNAAIELIERVEAYKLSKILLHRRHVQGGRQDDAVEHRDDNDTKTGIGNDTADRMMYEVEMVRSGVPGQYWCEAHLVPTFTHLVSQPVLAYRQPNGKSFFSATVELLLNRTNVESISLSSYEKRIAYHIKQNRGRHRELKPIYDTIKSVQVKRVERAWAMTEGRWHVVRLILHVVMKRVNSWQDFPAAEELLTNEIELPEKYVYYYKMRRYLNNALEALKTPNIRFIGVNSTEFCLPDTLQITPGGIIWWSARLGETVAPKNLCLVERTGLPLTRRCLGDFLYGCAWENEQLENEECSHVQHPGTRALFEYSIGQLNQSMLPHVFQAVGDVLTVPGAVLPADLFYISKTLENMRHVLVPEEDVSTNGKHTVLDLTNRIVEQYYCNISAIMNRLMYVNKSIVVRSQVALNTTNILLDAVESIMNGMALANDSTLLLGGAQFDCNRFSSAPINEEDELVLARNDGTVLFRSPRLIVLIADPTVANISGMALFRTVTTGQISPAGVRQNEDGYISEELMDEEGDFSNYTIRYLYMNQSQKTLLVEPELEIGSFIPQTVLENLGSLQAAMAESDEDSDSDEGITKSTDMPVTPGAPLLLRVVVVIYYNDRPFRETNNGTIARPNAKVISVTIPGYGSRMPEEIPIYTRQRNPDRASRCGYWSFDTDDNPAEFGRWSYDECRLLNISDSSPLTLCGCYHLTSFSRLTMDTQMVETVGVSKKLIADQSTHALDIITVIGCALSLLGVVGILATAIMFPRWREKASSKILMQLSCAIAVEMIIIFFEGPDIDKHRISTLDHIECTLLGSVFHYIILVTFMWMLVLAYLQFMRYVKVLGRLRPSHFILKASLCCWGVPSLPVVTFLILDHTLYLKQDNFSDICYPHGSALYYGLLLPIGVIIFLNFLSFIFVLYNIFAIPRNLTKTADHDMTLAQMRLSVFLFFLLGLPWIFGMLTSGGINKLFAYLFCLTAPLQGFVLFVYFIVMDPIARRLWLRKLQRCPCIERMDKQLDEKENTSPNTLFNTHL